MNIKTAITFLTTVAMMMAGLTSCLGGKMMNSTATGGEVTGISNGRGFTEPTPYGMVKINRGSLPMGNADTGEGHQCRWLLDGPNRGEQC